MSVRGWPGNGVSRGDKQFSVQAEVGTLYPVSLTEAFRHSVAFRPVALCPIRKYTKTFEIGGENVGKARNLVIF